ncbi:substrate-binding periplasmic protein (plasmid) [Pseudoalteromonas sp. T1lg65]|uniref:substrate-binding periplasmic protein n=1 Tax=Pseudoalteromonas sp. T1lg65 TaxID=2077101 RepID=UPI003F79DB05
MKYSVTVLMCLPLWSIPCWGVKLNVVTEQWRPYNYTDEQGKIVGRATQKVREVLDAAGVDYEIRIYPWVRAMKIAQTTPNTMIYSIFRNETREHLFQWACPLLQPVGEYFFKLKARHDIKIQSTDDAKKYAIAVVKGSAIHEFLVQQGFEQGINLDVTAGVDGLYKKLVAGRVDLLLASEFTMYEGLKKINVPYETVEAIYEVKKVTGQKACMAFNHQTDAKIIERIRVELEKHNELYIGP